MWSEKKQVLVALCVGMAIAVVLYMASIICAQAGKVYAAEACFLVFIPFFLYSFNRAEEWIFLDKEQKVISAYDAAHPSAIPPTRIAAIVNRQRRRKMA